MHHERRAEVAGMRWSEIADDLGQWLTLPGARMKGGRPHDVQVQIFPRPRAPISRTIPRVDGCDFVFSTTGRTPISGISKAKITLDAAIVRSRTAAVEKASPKPAGLTPWRLHDLRRTGVPVLARLGFDSIVADKLLAHQPAKRSGSLRCISDTISLGSAPRR